MNIKDLTYEEYQKIMKAKKCQEKRLVKKCKDCIRYNEGCEDAI